MREAFRIVAAVVVAGSITACASTEKVLSQQPREVVTSTKPQADVAFCLANKNNQPALDAPDGAKIVQVKNGVGATGMVFSVYAVGTGSRIEIRKPIGISIGTHRQCY